MNGPLTITALVIGGTTALFVTAVYFCYDPSKKGRCQALRANHARLETIDGAIG